MVSRDEYFCFEALKSNQYFMHLSVYVLYGCTFVKVLVGVKIKV
jgi:hypothetical protein